MSQSNSAVFKSILVLLGYRYLIIGFLSVLFVLCTIYNVVSDKEYSVNASFFSSGGTPAQSSFVSSYSMFIGGSIPQNLDNLIPVIMSSRFLQNFVTKKIQPDYPDLTYAEVVSLLDLGGKTFLTQKNGVFTLEYLNKDPELAVKVINLQLQAIKAANDTMSLSPQKKLIQIIDTPVLPKTPSKPRILVNYILTLGAGSMFIIFIVLVIEAFKVEIDIFKHK